MLTVTSAPDNQEEIAIALVPDGLIATETLLPVFCTN